jgi:putative SOS response-associated peptidase YedK
MCSNFEAILTPTLLQERFGIRYLPEDMPDTPCPRPGNLALILTRPAKAVALTWGLTPDWSSRLLINARSESLLRKPTFASARDQRCLIPASAWFEWRHDERGKHKNRISIKGVDGFALAGIYDGDRFCILTCPPHTDIAHIHDRMPVLIAPPHYDRWLAPGIPSSQLQDLLGTPRNIAFDTVEERTNKAQLHLL